MTTSRTEDDLRQVIRAEADDLAVGLGAEPPSDGGLRLPAGAPGQHRRAGVLAAVALVLAVVGGTFIVTRSSSHRTAVGTNHTLPATGGIDPAFTFAAGPLPGRTTVRYLLSDAEMTEFSDADGVVDAWMAVYRSGAFDPGTIVGSWMTLAGHDALVGVGPSAVDRGDGLAAPASVATAGWTLADGRWVVVQHQDRLAASPPAAQPVPPAQLVALAATVRPDGREPVTLPFSVGYVPAGAALQTARSNDDSVTGGPSVYLSYGAGASSLGITFIRGAFSSTTPKVGTSFAPTRVMVQRQFGDYSAMVTATGYDQVELQRVLDSIAVVPDPSDTSTWLDATR
jgi:hypothetical protein